MRKGLKSLMLMWIAVALAPLAIVSSVVAIPLAVVWLGMPPADQDAAWDPHPYRVSHAAPAIVEHRFQRQLAEGNQVVSCYPGRGPGGEGFNYTCAVKYRRNAPQDIFLRVAEDGRVLNWFLPPY